MAAPTLVQHVASAYNPLGLGETGNAFKFTLPNPVLAGNCLILGISYQFSVSRTVTVTDNNGNTWPASSAVTTNDGGNLSIAIFVLPNANAGVTQVTVTFDTAVIPFQYSISEFYNLATASPVDGTSSNNSTTAPNLTAGSLAPATDNNANGGHLVWSYFVDDVGGHQTTSFAPGTGAALLHADIGWISQGMPHASQYDVVESFASFPLTPAMTANMSVNDGYLAASVALKAASAGTAPAAVGIRIVRVNHSSINTPPTAWKLQCPTDGNLFVLVMNENQTVVVSSVVDNYSRSLQKYETDASEPQFWILKNAAAHNDLLLTLNLTGSSGRSVTMYDIAEADPDPVDATGDRSVYDNPTGANITDTPIITPGSTNGLTIVGGMCGIGPCIGLNTGSPTGAIFDFVVYTGQTDGSGMDNSDIRAHYFNGSDLTAEHWNWIISNGGVDSTHAAMAVHFRGQPVPPVQATSHEPLAAFDPELIPRAWFDAETIERKGWFDVDLLGPITIYETKGAFDPELVPRAWFDAELIATRNWFDVELPVPSGSSVSLAGAISGAGAVAAQLTLAEALAAYVAGQATPTGKLSLAESLAGNLSGQATLAGALSLAEALAGSVAGTAAASGSLVEAIALQGGLTGTSAASASLSEAVALQGSLAGVSAPTGLLSESIALQGVLAGDSALTGNLGTGSGVALAGSVAGASALTGSLAEAIALQGALAGGSTLPGSLALAEALQGVVVGSAAVSAPLSLAEALQAIVAGTAASPSATLSIAVSLQGILAGTTSSTGNLSTPGVAALAGIIAGASSPSASMSETVLLQGSFAASASFTGITSDLRSIAGVISGTSKFSGALGLGLQLSGAVQGAGVGTVGTLLEVVRLQGALASASALSALISAFDPNTVGPALAGRQDLAGLRGVADLNSLAGIQTLGSLKGKVT